MKQTSMWVTLGMGLFLVFGTEAIAQTLKNLRNNLVGLPLDLGVLNLNPQNGTPKGQVSINATQEDIVLKAHELVSTILLRQNREQASIPDTTPTEPLPSNTNQDPTGIFKVILHDDLF